MATGIARGMAAGLAAGEKGGDGGRGDVGAVTAAFGGSVDKSVGRS